MKNKSRELPAHRDFTLNEQMIITIVIDIMGFYFYRMWWAHRERSDYYVVHLIMCLSSGAFGDNAWLPCRTSLSDTLSSSPAWDHVDTFGLFHTVFCTHTSIKYILNLFLEQKWHYMHTLLPLALFANGWWWMSSSLIDRCLNLFI